MGASKGRGVALSDDVQAALESRLLGDEALDFARRLVQADPLDAVYDGINRIAEHLMLAIDWDLPFPSERHRDLWLEVSLTQINGIVDFLLNKPTTCSVIETGLAGFVAVPERTVGPFAESSAHAAMFWFVHWVLANTFDEPAPDDTCRLRSSAWEWIHENTFAIDWGACKANRQIEYSEAKRLQPSISAQHQPAPITLDVHGKTTPAPGKNGTSMLPPPRKYRLAHEIAWALYSKAGENMSADELMKATGASSNDAVRKAVRVAKRAPFAVRSANGKDDEGSRGYVWPLGGPWPKDADGRDVWHPEGLCPDCDRISQ